MTFNLTPAECYVYLTLPGQTTPVTAGRFTLTTNRQGVPIGRFIYGKHYLARPDAVPLDPVELKLSSKIYETVALKGVFGAIRDAGPDYWGRRVIERYLGTSQLSEMSYLLYSADDRAGALSFGLHQMPPAPRRIFNQTIELEKLQRMADAMVNDEDLPDDAINNQIEELLLIGTSMGGARPKAVVEDQEALWIAKFNRPDDKWNNACVEHAMLMLARACGLTTAESRIIRVSGREVLLVKRFDREKMQDGYLRSRMISALTLLRAEDNYTGRDKWSYILLAEELRRCCAEPKKESIELFRRMCFNALISNIDDHPRNHAIIAKDRQWKLSPAYDLTVLLPISIERRELAMICGDSGRFANAANILSQSPRFMLEKDEAINIVKNMENQVRSTWYPTARAAGVSERDCEKIKYAFNYPGFLSHSHNLRGGII
jgi:serine/threonine-protein kinase HipA